MPEHLSLPQTLADTRQPTNVRLVVPYRERLTTQRWRLTAGTLLLPDLGALSFQTGDLYVSSTHAYAGLTASGQPHYAEIYLLDSLEVRGLLGAEQNIDTLVSKLADAKTAREAALAADPAEAPDYRRGRLQHTCLAGVVLVSFKAALRSLTEAYFNCRVEIEPHA